MLIILSKSFFIYYAYRDRVFAIGELTIVDDPNSSYFEYSVVSRFNELRFYHSNARANKIENQI